MAVGVEGFFVPFFVAVEDAEHDPLGGVVGGDGEVPVEGGAGGGRLAHIALDGGDSWQGPVEVCALGERSFVHGDCAAVVAQFFVDEGEVCE